MSENGTGCFKTDVQHYFALLNTLDSKIGFCQWYLQKWAKCWIDGCIWYQDINPTKVLQSLKTKMHKLHISVKITINYWAKISLQYSKLSCIIMIASFCFWGFWWGKSIKRYSSILVEFSRKMIIFSDKMKLKELFKIKYPLVQLFRG